MAKEATGRTFWDFLTEAWQVDGCLFVVVAFLLCGTIVLVVLSCSSFGAQIAHEITQLGK